jgi:hypothetical protein
VIDQAALVAAGIIPARPKPTTRPTAKAVRPKPVQKRPVTDKDEVMIMEDMVYSDGQWRQMTPQEIRVLRATKDPSQE